VTHPSHRAVPRLAGLAGAALAVIAYGLATGSADLPWHQAVDALVHDDGSTTAAIVHQVRVPRVLSAFSVGALLALAGALLQVLVRNPLADPYITGTAGGAAAAFLLGALAGLPAAGYPLAAFAGALASTGILAGLARLGSTTDTTRLLLIGVMLAAGWGAVITLMLSVAPGARLPGLLFWLLGDLDATDGWPLAAGTLAIGLLAALAIARPLNLLAFGTTGAAALGVPVARVQTVVFLLASLATAVAVSIAGPIGFIGLVAPHLVRRGITSDHRVLLPGSAIAGGTLLVLADALARTLTAPVRLPVGVITALLGVPLFIAALTLEGRRHGR
jgi:iron complex transport system permease protein